MQTVSDFFTTLPGVPIEHMLALIARAGLAIYVVFTLVRERRGK